MKCVIMIDGGYLRACARAARFIYDNDFIEKFTPKCVIPDEYLLRVYYYDSPQFRGTVQLPVSGGNTQFQASDKWLDDLSRLERFAVRRGTLGFRGWKPRNIPLKGGGPLKDEDFSPVFEQKGVDMRIGLDIAHFSQERTTERIILVSGDTDMIPAMKEARKAGLEVVLIQLDSPSKMLHGTLKSHADMIRSAAWP